MGTPRPSGRQGQHGAALDTRKGPASGRGPAPPGAQNRAAAAGTVRGGGGTRGDHGGCRAPSLRAQDQQVARPRPPPGGPHVAGPRPGAALRPRPGAARVAPVLPGRDQRASSGRGRGPGRREGGRPGPGLGNASPLRARWRLRLSVRAGGTLGACPGGLPGGGGAGKVGAGSLRAPSASPRVWAQGDL